MPALLAVSSYWQHKPGTGLQACWLACVRLLARAWERKPFLKLRKLVRALGAPGTAPSLPWGVLGGSAGDAGGYLCSALMVSRGPGLRLSMSLAILNSSRVWQAHVQGHAVARHLVGLQRYSAAYRAGTARSAAPVQGPLPRKTSIIISFFCKQLTRARRQKGLAARQRRHPARRARSGVPVQGPSPPQACRGWAPSPAAPLQTLCPACKRTNLSAGYSTSKQQRLCTQACVPVNPKGKCQAAHTATMVSR